MYDPEATNLFGAGHLAFQVHLSQTVNVEFTQTFQDETLTETVESGFKIETGGQRDFLECLRQLDAFETVILIEQKEGLSPPQVAPTNMPSLTPTPRPSLAPTKAPSSSPTRGTLTPSVAPTKLPTVRPTPAPSKQPSQSPSDSPTPLPTQLPTEQPSISPTESPTVYPSTLDTISPTITGTSVSPVVQTTPIPTAFNQILDSGISISTPSIDPLIIAAVAGGITTLLVVCLCAMLFYWRKQLHPRRRYQPKFALTSRDGERGKQSHDFIPGIVELDQRSLAETSLGDETAGRKKPKKFKKGSSQAIRPIDSFDDSSLYTTPFSVQRDEASGQIQTRRPPTFSQPTIPPIEYDGNILFPLSDSGTTSSDGLSSLGQLAGRISAAGSPADLKAPRKPFGVSRVTGPIDLDTDSPYTRVSKLDPEAVREVFPEAEEEASTAFDIDAWSFDFEDFDKPKDPSEDFVKHEDPSLDEAQSKAPSQSSKTTIQVQNKPRSSKHGAHRIRKQDAAEEVEATVESKIAVDKLDPGIVPDPEDSNIEKLYRNLMMDKHRLESTPSPQKPKRSHSSAASRASWGSKQVHTGQDTKILDSSETKAGQSSSEVGEKAKSPFFKLLDSVAEVASPAKFLAQTRAVTPENDDPEFGHNTDLSFSKDDDSTTLVGLQFRDDVSASSGGESSAVSNGPWLFEKVEESLGPKSVTADMESLGGKSNRSTKSPGAKSRAGTESNVSFGSQFSHRSSLIHGEIAFQPRTLEHDMKRLEKQLASMDSDQISTSSAGVSSITGASLTRASVASRNRPIRVNRRKRVVVMVPAGKLGVILANFKDGKGTLVSEIRENSPTFGMLSVGDRLIGVDNNDVAKMTVSEVTAMIASRASRERRLTVLTAVPQPYSN